jgi:hypothetical protein
MDHFGGVAHALFVNAGLVANNQLTTRMDVVRIDDRSEPASSLRTIDTDVENRR